ncbi:MAG: glycosyltransferase family 2 protein [Flavobacteriaceae bacterium]|jgi:GT2 family glycosyltransferase|nr:glycosyltransferase family 2 protein [Flavobacteriaceae bacterium]
MEIHKRNRLQTLAIVILNYNGISWFAKFLQGIINYSPGSVIYVIDNASTDDSLDYLAKNFPSVRVVRNHQNLGYAGGYNNGLKFVPEDIYCLLNSDVEVTEGWTFPILSLFEREETIAAIQPKILGYKNKEKFEFAGAGGGFIDNLGYPFCRGRVFFSLEEDKGQYDDIQEVFWATGACLFIRRKDFWEQGGFDPVFFAHMEEIDLCWRLKNAGKKIYYCGQSTVYHVGGGTLNPHDPHKTFLNFRNNHLMLIKNLPSDKIFQVMFFRLILDGFSGIDFIFSGGWKYCWAIIRAHFAVYKLLPEYLKKRKAGIPDYFDKKYVVFQYFLRKRTKYTDLN